MKTKWMPLLALMLCVGLFLCPLTVHAAGDKDTTPPTLTATLDEGTLHIEADDDNSGVEAVYIDSTRVNSLADGRADVLLKDYAGNGKQVSVYAVDYTGNRSQTVTFDNPYYQAPAALSTPTAPVASVTSAPAAATPASSSSGADAGVSSDSGSNGSESAIVEGDNVFTPEGTGTVVDTATDADGKLFYTIVTPDGNVFYLVIDMQRTDGNNVYFLNAVTEADLLALAEIDTAANGESAIPVPDPDPAPESRPDDSAGPETSSEPEPAQEGGGFGSILFVLLAAAAVGVAGYYIKILRPKRQAALNDEEDEENGEEDGDGYDEDGAEEVGYDLPDVNEEREAEAYQSGDGTEYGEE